PRGGCGGQGRGGGPGGGGGAAAGRGGGGGGGGGGPIPGEAGRPRHAVAEPAERGHADRRGEHGEQHQDPGHQRGLVVGPECRDREVLQRRRGEVDGRAADRDHGGALRAGGPRDELPDGDRDGGGDQAGNYAYGQPGPGSGPAGR